jgi:hypothetical protein
MRRSADGIKAGRVHIRAFKAKFLARKFCDRYEAQAVIAREGGRSSIREPQ